MEMNKSLNSFDVWHYSCLFIFLIYMWSENGEYFVAFFVRMGTTSEIT